MMEKWEENATEKGRIYHFDIIRAVAIVCVLYNHTNKRGYYLYAFTDSLPLKIFYIALAAFIAVGVPLFFMVSGALLLKKEETIADLYKKRVSRILIVLVVFSIVQWLFRVADGRDELSAGFLFGKIFTDGVIAPYWFLYAYLAYLMILPLLRRLVQVMKAEDYRYLIGLLLIVEGVIPTILYPFGITELNGFFVLPFINRVVIYPLLGYYMEYVLPENVYENESAGKCRPTVRAVLAIAAVLAFFVVMTLIRNLPYEDFTVYDKGLYTCSFTALLDMAVYYLCKRAVVRRKPATSPTYGGNGNDSCGPSLPAGFIISFGGAAFGIYLIEQIVREHTTGIYDVICGAISKGAGDIGSFIACLIWLAVVAAVSYLITIILKKIPGLNKLL